MGCNFPNNYSHFFNYTKVSTREYSFTLRKCVFMYKEKAYSLACVCGLCCSVRSLSRAHSREGIELSLFS